ncbi:MAG: nicotinamide riboside transporter PnuC [Lachnospiraceae bacterium]|nr:nicotinamide riboside transporter PnuC [Lachnospiraceae bacterium]
MQKYVKSELTGWKKMEVAWLAIASAVILALSIYWKDSMIGIMSALTGVWCVILTGKGKRSSFIFGTINVLFYAYIAFGAKYYGEVMLNLIYYFPMNFVGWFAWNKHMNEENGEVIKSSLPRKKGIILYVCTAVAIFLYGLMLRALNGNLPFVDSMSTVVSVVAQILSVKRLTEQWVLWIVVDVVTVIMWAVNFANGGESIATLLMWSIYLLNAIIMYIRWKREVKENEI